MNECYLSGTLTNKEPWKSVSGICFELKVFPNNSDKNIPPTTMTIEISFSAFEKIGHLYGPGDTVVIRGAIFNRIVTRNGYGELFLRCLSLRCVSTSESERWPKLTFSEQEVVIKLPD